MASKASIYIYAGSIANSYVGLQPNGEVRDWELLKDIYDKAMEIPPNWLPLPQGDNLEALKKGRWLRKNGLPGGTTSPSEGISWCGIFATYVLRGVGLPALWKQNVGITTAGNLLEICTYNQSDQIEPGDICVKGTNQHHFIVYRRDGDKIYSYDGNLPGQSIGQRDYNIADMKKMARDADIEMAQKQKSMSKDEFQRHLQTHAKYNFYFYRLKKA